MIPRIRPHFKHFAGLRDVSPLSGSNRLAILTTQSTMAESMWTEP
jgi:hypothetical protein